VKWLALANMAGSVAAMLRRRARFALVPLALLVLILLGGLAGAEQPAEADARFESIARAYTDFYLQSNPERATTLGDHRFDDRLTDYSGAAIDAIVATNRKTLDQLNQIKAEELTGANRIDIEILRENISATLFNLTELKEFEWNPLIYNQSLADSIYYLLARDFSPAAERIASLKGRLAEIPRVIAQAEANLQHPPLIHTQTAIDQIHGAIAQVTSDLDTLVDALPQAKADIEPLRQTAAAALSHYADWLKEDLLPRSTGDFRLGETLYRKKLRLSLSSDLSKEEILARAEADLQATQEKMYQTALPLYRQYFPNAQETELQDKQRVCKSVLDQLAKRHPDNETILATAKAALAETTAFVRNHELLTLPNRPIKIIETPEFKRGVTAAYCDAPGPMDTHGETFFAIEPTPANWTPERNNSYYREYNDYMVHELTVHEAMPGHYVQLAIASEFRAPTLVRALFESGTFAEGWACYAEQMMAELGSGGPEVKMEQLKMRLRLIINAIIDQKVHTAGMTEEQAIALMMREGFQEEGEAAAKWKRCCLTSAQLSTYFVGTTEMLDLREAYRNKLNGEKFEFRKYHDSILAFGSPPPKYVKLALGL
jgi:uncharacterized protein (DUF885 family)